jgi:hypothetical protein
MPYHQKEHQAKVVTGVDQNTEVMVEYQPEVNTYLCYFKVKGESY